MSAAARVAVITGAASSIGRATALRLGREGYRLVLVDVDAAGLQTTMAALREHGDGGEAFAVDVSDAHKLGDMIRTVATRVGVPVLLVNVSGLGIAATVPETSDEDWSRVITTNLTGPFLVTRAILPLMLDAEDGVIINVASVAALVGIPAHAAYCASEAGLVGLTRAIAADHAAAGIRCVAICPGTVEPEWIERTVASEPDPSDMRSRMAARQLDGRLGTPEEVAATIAFVASADGRFFNGAAVVLDGGMTAV